jgi:hypothetical protein
VTRHGEHSRSDGWLQVQPDLFQLNVRAAAEPCQHCGARPGEWCTTKDGTETVKLHKVRLRMAKYVPVNA